MSAAQNMVDFFRGFGERARAAHIKDQLKNYLTDPDATIKAVNQIDAPTAIALNSQHINEEQAAQAAQQATQKRQLDNFGQVTSFLRSARDNGQTDMGAALDSISPFLKTALGADDNQISTWKQTIASNPGLLDAMDTEAQKAKAKLAGDVHVVGPGAALAVGGKVTYAQPSVPKVLQVPNASGGRDVITVDPNQPPIGTPGTGTGVGNVPMTADALMPFFKEQESHGDYTAVNKDTGALGAHQVMPGTGAALAKKLGMAWRPDMMSSDTPAARRYQDAIGSAARQEAIDHSGGDPAAAFSYYYSGSPTAYQNPQGNPKTAKYVQDMMARISGDVPGAAPGAAPGVHQVYSTTGQSKQVRTATPEEIVAAGYPEGTAAQVKPDGSFTNIKTPPAGAAAKGNPIDTYKESKSAIADIRNNLIKLRDDPGLGTATGITGAALSYIPGTHRKYLEGLTAQINAQKLVGLATALKSSGGNPFSRITNMEAQQLPKTLGNFDLNQSVPDIRKNINDAIKQLDALEGRVDGAAARTGILKPATPRPGATPNSNRDFPSAPPLGAVRKGFKYNGGDPSQRGSWSPVK